MKPLLDLRLERWHGADSYVNGPKSNEPEVMEVPLSLGETWINCDYWTGCVVKLSEWPDRRCGVNTTIMTTSSATTTFVSSTTTTSATETRTSFTSTKTTKTTSLAPVTFTGTTVHSQSTTDIEDQTEKECNPFSGWRYLSFKSCAQVELDLGKGT